MKVNKKIFICALLVLMLFVCINAASAESTLDTNLTAEDSGEIAIDEADSDVLSASGDTYYVDANGGGDYKTISDAVGNATGGETIFVKNGEYSEANTITFTKSVSIVGESQDGVKITGATKSLFSTVEPAIALSLNNLTILNAGSGSYPALKLTYSAHNLTVTNCTFDNCGSKYGTMQLGHPGTAIIDNCKILNSKETTSAGSGAIYVSGAGDVTIKNSIIDNVQYNVSSSYMYGVIYVYNANAVLTIENTTISNCTGPTRGIINTVGTVNIKGSKIQDNSLSQYSETVTNHLVYIGDKGTVNIEQTEISDNTCVDQLFNNYKDTSKLTVNYCNIHDNAANGTVNDLGTIDLEANYWGSNDKPADVTATTWVVEDNGQYKLNTGEALAKDIPGLADESGSNIVTNDTFYNFFDESGILKDSVTYDELIFQGAFSDLGAGYVIITKPVTITGDEAVLNDMGVMISSKNVALDNLTLIATTSLGSLITVTESNVDLTNLIISYIVGDDEAIAIDVRGTDTISDINILNNTIYFESHVSDDSGYATAINLEDVEDVIVDGNDISASVPALYVETYDWNYFMMGLVYVNPVRIYEGYRVEFTDNNMDVVVNKCTASYPTTQAIYIVGSEDVLIKGNNFTMIDTATPLGTSIYLYAVECGFSDDISFIENNFDISTTGGKSGAGSAYALQVATSEVEIIANNITCDSNGPNLGIFSPYGFGSAKDMDIQNNFLNISGYAAGSNDFALISGIEVQTGYATIYNNTIYVQNKGEYDDTYPVSGISAIQYSASTLTFDIKDNEVYTNGKYAIEMLYPPQSAVVVGNTLCANELFGTKAVYIKSGDNNEVHDNLPTNIVTNDTFFNFFDEWGMLLDTVTFDELIFQGEFSDLVDAITIYEEITLTGENAVLNNISLCIIGDDVIVNGFTLNENEADFSVYGGAAIFVTGSDVTLDNVSVTYVAPSQKEAIAVFANGADNFALINSEIIFTGANPGSNHYRGLEVRNSDEAIINNNTIIAVLPAVSVDWSGSGIGQDLVLAVGIQGGDDIEFTDNRVVVNTNGAVGSYPTIDAVMVHSANDILIEGNNITHIDTTTEDSARYYYSLDIYSTTGTVEANNIIVNTTAGVDRAGTAYPIQLTGPYTIAVLDNNLTAISKGPIAGIYTSNWGGPATLIVDGNNIDVTGYATTGNFALVAGIEAEIDMLKAYNNVITVENGADYDDANQVIGVGIGSSYFYGNTSADIKDNTIIVDGKYAVYYAKAVNSNVTGNNLYGHNLTGNDAAAIESGENNVIEDNRPYGGVIYVDINGSDDNLGTFDAPVATIAKAVELALGYSGIIIVNEGTYDAPQIEITGDLDISGNGTVVLEAQDATKKAFWIRSGDVSISGVTFTNFNATYNGAVIRVDAGSLAIDNSKFIKNGGEHRQALIQVKGADLTLTNTVFENNTASKTGTSYGNVYLTNNGNLISTLYANNVTFKNNHNKYGAFYLGSTIAAIYNSSFIGNNATSTSGGNGAGIYASGTGTYISSYSGNLMNGSASYVLIEGCDFINNTAFGGTYYQGQGGAIYANNNVTMIITDCLFENNSVRNTTGNDKPGQGGAIYASAGKIIIEKSIFKNNDAAQGPEIYMRYYNNHLHPEEVNTLDISNSIILNDGVAIVADSTNGTYVANDNWWGANDNVTDNVINVTVDSWAKMNASFTPVDAFTGDEVTITAEFDNKNLPNGINVTFTSTSGSLNDVVTTEDGQATTTYTINGDNAIIATSGSAVIEMPIMKPVILTADSVWVGSNATVSVSVPNATGNITIEINNKSYVVELVDGVATKEISAEDLVIGENSIIATYDGPDYTAKTANGMLVVVNGVVTQDTYLYYFNQDDNGKLFDYIPEGATLDFQGSIINPNQTITVQMNVNKPVNIITSTNDAYVDLNTTAGSLLGESPGNSFAITYGGSGSNVTGIKFHNTQLWFSNTHNVTLDNISNVVEDQRVGSGVGATSIRDNSTNVLLKNSYFYTRNNGGSTTFTMSWATNCTIDNCTVKAEGNVGNLIYLNIYNIVGAPAGVPLNNYNTVSNNKIYGKEGSGISVGLMVEGTNNLIVNNTLYKSSISTSFGGQNPANNTYVGNTMTDGSGLTAQTYSIVYGNNVTGALSTGKGSVAYDNVVGGKLTVGQEAIVYNNTVGNGLTTGGTNAVIENNTITGAVTINKVGTTFVGNDVNATVTVSANNNVIKGNDITSTGNYAVDLGSKTGNNVTDNNLVAEFYKGDAAVKFNNENNVVENNTPVAPIVVDAVDVWIGNNSTITVDVNNATGSVTIIVNGKNQTIDLVDGVAAIDVASEELVVGENNVTVIYNGPEYAPVTVEDVLFVLDGVITNSTYKYYFDASGNLVSAVPDGATLDFQGLFLGKFPVYINKAVNVVSTTGDALFDAGETFAGNNINSFNIVTGGDNTNITGLKFINNCLYIKGASNVTVDDISIVANKRGVGSGTGFLSIHTGAYNTVVKNSYFENGGTGSSLLVLGKGGAYAYFDHNIFNITGSSGNILSANQYVGSGDSPEHVSYTNNVLYNNQPGSAFCYAMTVSGSGNLVENNTIYHNGSGILNQYGATSSGNVYRNNTLYGNTNFNPSANSIVEGNKIYATTNIAANTVATDNIFDNVAISGTNTTFTDNTVLGTVTVKGNNNCIEDNVIISTGEYAVDLGSTAGNNVTDNILYGQELNGDDAVKYSDDTNIVVNNGPYVPDFTIEVENITVGETAVINIKLNEDIDGTVNVIVDGEEYPVDIVGGVGQLNVTDLPASNYAVTAKFPANLEYKDAKNRTVFNVAKKDAGLNITPIADAKIGDKVNITVDSETDGALTIKVNGETVTGEYEIAKAGAYTITVESAATDSYDVGFATYTFEVPEPTEYNITVVVDGTDYNATVVNGTATVDTDMPEIIDNLTDELADANDKVANLTDELADANDKVANLTDELADANDKVANLTDELADANDKVANLTGELADANAKVDNLTKELEDALAKIPQSVVVDGKEYPAQVVNGTITITTEPVKLIPTVIESEYKFTRQANDWDAGERGDFFYAVLKDVNGNPLANMSCLVAVNGPIYNVTTDEQGRFGVQVNLAKANTYTYALSFLGDDKYSASFNSTKLILTAKKTSITASAKTYKAKATKTFSVTLKTVKNPYDGKTYLNKGKKITLTINGKTYTAKTNAKGVAKFTIKLTKKGKYTAKVKFAGDKTYKASSKSVKITIK